MAERYIFDDSADVSELQRLELLESVFDPKTREWLTAAGALENRRCLEVGAGAGSVARWLADAVGPNGRVTAVDTNVRYLAGLRERVQVVAGNLAELPLAEAAFDLVHVRYVLIHNANADALLDAMLRLLAPGGTLVLEEPDFGVASALVGPTSWMQSFDAVVRATNAMFAARGLDGSFGRRLPEFVRARGLSAERVEFDCHAEPGGSGLAAMMGLSTLALGDKYMATGQATNDDVERYREFAASPVCVGIYYATVRVLVRKPAM
jgi:SAM-dependent methyltransferase